MRVSATLIVRDELIFIEGCLQSLVGIVDEIVVVDTGSRDDTIEKALRFPNQAPHLRVVPRLFRRPQLRHRASERGMDPLYRRG